MELSENIGPRIRVIRQQRVILAADLAELYGVSVRRLNEQVRRNLERFPADFAFQLTDEEWISLKSQIATSKGRGGVRKLPWAFTEHGAIQAANVLNSPRAIQVGLAVVRAFVANYVELEDCVRRLAEKVEGHDTDLAAIVAAIRQLASSSVPGKRRKIGFG
ncbi:MAG: hypothetical protein RL495_1143 [Verrucomicrobiota bacterium]|jgi:hypothetical protein